MRNSTENDVYFNVLAYVSFCKISHCNAVFAVQGCEGGYAEHSDLIYSSA